MTKQIKKYKEVDYNNKIVVKINEFYKDITIYKLKKCDDEKSNTYSNYENRLNIF